MTALGRLVRHDSRSRAFPAETSALRSVKWPTGPVLDQGALGSCTGHAAAAVVNSLELRAGSKAAMLGEPEALAIYSAATLDDRIDGTWPPVDAGSSGLGAARALRGFGLASRYAHAFGLDHCLAALAASPVMLGIPWLQGMFDPRPDGTLDVTGDVAGGHELAGVALDINAEVVWLQNSWGEQWGRHGLAAIRWDDLGQLLDAQGDVTVPLL